MIENLPTLSLLLKQLQQVPYVASKNLYRVAHHFLEMDFKKSQEFCVVLQKISKNLIKCGVCWAWREHDSTCIFCDSPKRNKAVICVVETWHDLYAIEKTGCYQGVYHVLGSAICPLEGIGPDDLTIEHLLQRVNNGCEEVILAMNQTPEGEATAAFISSKLKRGPYKVTCLAKGVPVGSTLEFTDRLTVVRALADRRLF
jgi:recombination protein RecR